MVLELDPAHRTVQGALRRHLPLVLNLPTGPAEVTLSRVRVGCRVGVDASCANVGTACTRYCKLDMKGFIARDSCGGATVP